MTHDELQEQATDLCGVTGWLFLHVRKSIGKGRQWQTTTNRKGWPDLAPLWSPRQPGRFLAIEVKIPPDVVRQEQVEVLTELAQSGMETFVLYPGRGKLIVPSSSRLVTIEELALVLSPRHPRSVQ